MKNLGVVITDGVGFRNFILSDFISEAQHNFDAVVIYSCIPESAFQKYNLNCKIVELDQFNEKFITWFFRKAKEVAHLQLHRKNNFGIKDNFNINIEAIEAVCSLITTAYQNTVDGTRNRTYVICIFVEI